MSINAMKLALRALENPWEAGAEGVADAIIALRAAIEQAQEPVCDKDPQGCWSVRCQLGKICKHTAPRQWQGLDEVEIVGATCECVDDGTFNMDCAMEFARAIESKLKEKNT